MKSIKRIGSGTDPRRTPLVTLEICESTNSILICWNLSERKAVIHEMSKSGRPIWHNLKMRLLCLTDSKAFENYYITLHYIIHINYIYARAAAARRRSAIRHALLDVYRQAFLKKIVC